MNRKIMVFVVGLLALGALEFGLLGASASGIVGGSGNTLPPIADRGNVPVATATPETFPTSTPTPASAPDPGCAISPPDSSPPCSSLAASIELNQPQPSAIQCDGSSTSLLHVTLRNRFGNVVDDGTPVQFSVFNGSPSPYFALTKNGQAETSIVIYSDSYSYEPNVSVRSGEMETAIRVRCLPNSGCPLSPPPDSSPPCGPTPFPCNPSPGADINSPPCVIETPISPPICFPGQTSPPCTPLSPPECDPNDPTSPICTPATPISPPLPPSSIGGQIYIGTTTLVDGKIRVPVNTTAPVDPFVGFNVHLRFVGDLASIVDPTRDVTPGDIFDPVETGNTFCARAPSPLYPQEGFILGCIDLVQRDTTSAGTLAIFTLTPKAASGCMLLSISRYGGDSFNGTYTVSPRSVPQANTYGDDIYVNLANGDRCLPAGGTGGAISIGAPELVDGKLRVPVDNTASANPYSAFNVHVVWDGAFASIANIGSDSLPGDVFGDAELFCARSRADDDTPDRNGSGGLILGCTTFGETQTSGDGHLADFWLTPNTQAGTVSSSSSENVVACLRLHLVTYSIPDFGGAAAGTYTLGRGAFGDPHPQLNTYGPDVYVNTADGTPCTPTPEATPTPPGPDAQTATAIAVQTATAISGPPQSPTDTPTAVPTWTAVPTSTAVPTATPERAVCADVTGDGRVTGRDVAAIIAHTFGRYRAQYDLNGDHRVNRQDVQIALRQLGRRC